MCKTGTHRMPLLYIYGVNTMKCNNLCMNFERNVYFRGTMFEFEYLRCKDHVLHHKIRKPYGDCELEMELI